MKYRIAIASTDGKVVNEHFGRSSSFYIVDTDSETGKPVYRENRRVEPVCAGGEHAEGSIQKTAQELFDCPFLLVSRIGCSAQAILEEKGIQVFELPGVIEESIQQLMTYLEIQKLLKR